jgi:hypothetical protein
MIRRLPAQILGLFCSKHSELPSIEFVLFLVLRVRALSQLHFADIPLLGLKISCKLISRQHRQTLGLLPCPRSYSMIWWWSRYNGMIWQSTPRLWA